MNHILLGLAGIAVIILIAVLFSSNRRAIRLRVVGAAFALQAAIALFVFKTTIGVATIKGMAFGVANLLGYAGKGTEFLFGPSASNPLANTFAIAALPVIIFAMALSGGMVAGLRAGYAYNTFPLMNGHVVPPEVMLLEPWWRNFVYNMATVQLVHRTFFWLLAVLVPLAWWRGRHTLAANALLAAFVLQASLGIATLLLGVPVGFGSAHQGGAVVLLAAALWHAHGGKRS